MTETKASTVKQKILKFIFQMKKTSKMEISTELSLSMPTVLSTIKELVNEGLVTETGSFESTGGRRAKKITIVEDKYYSLGIDITANHISIVMLNFCGEVILKKRIRKKFENSLDYFEKIFEIMEDFICSPLIKCKDKILGIGISFPGIIDKDQEILVKSHALQVERMSLKNISHLISFPVLYENDSNSAALAELHGQTGDAIYLSLSNTVGGAIFYNGMIYEGANYRSGEFGHVVIHSNGKKCYCGRSGCFDAYCSAHLLSDLTDGDLSLFFEKLENGDRNLELVWNEYIDNLALEVSNLRTIFDCDIILGGYVGGYMEKYLNTLRKKVLQYNMFDEDVTFLKNCKIKSEASAVGIAMQFIDNFIYNL